MLDWLSGFLIAILVGTLVEYWAHRMMHSWLLKKKHALHHRDGWGQGWLGEFWDYFIGTVPVMAGAFALCYWWLENLMAGIGFISGGVFYACWAAYSHQLQHEKPDLCFWLPRPVHHLHHYGHMWHHNFGISLDLWDRVSGPINTSSGNANVPFANTPGRVISRSSGFSGWWMVDGGWWMVRRQVLLHHPPSTIHHPLLPVA